MKSETLQVVNNDFRDSMDLGAKWLASLPNLYCITLIEMKKEKSRLDSTIF